MSIDVRLRAEWVENVGYRYDVLFDEEVIVSCSRDPEHDAARVLHARGLLGRLRTIDFVTGKLRMSLDIEEAAKLCTIERDDGGAPLVRPYRTMSDSDKTRIAHRSRQGCAISAKRFQGTGPPDKRAGDETAVASHRVPEEA